ncbi:uncharacterized protein LOC123315581 [Coccinella septempunctata]|uniref:uncharacterized protein LOC123315581 n=1 Tax=Coccinella septempunctata TaxID=41139 RepID=UPI001D0718C6|nr:uncharacterized protein LOC123315581 [Coccinella septempunctata]
MQFHLSLSLVSCILCVNYVVGFSYDIIDGQCNNTESLNELFHKKVKKSGIIFWTAYSKVEYYGDTVITCIKVVNTWRDGTGGSARIVEGGVGHYFAIIEMHSQFCRGLSFDIRIYAQNFKKFIR